MTIGGVHISAPLTNVAIEYKNPDFIAEKALPVLPVKKESDKYWIFGRDELIRKDDLRAPGAPANEVEIANPTTNTYSCEEHSLKKIVPQRLIDNSDAAIQPKSRTTEKLVKMIYLNYEYRTQQLLQSSGNFSSTFAADTYDQYWSDTANVDIEKQVRHAKELVLQQSGVIPNTMILNTQTKDYLAIWLRESSENSYNELVRGGEFPDRIWGLDIIIGESVYNTAEEGQTESLSGIWNDNVPIYYRESATPDLQTLSFGYTFRARDFVTKEWWDNERNGYIIETGFIQQEKIIAAGCGCLITNCIE